MRFSARFFFNDYLGFDNLSFNWRFGQLAKDMADSHGSGLNSDTHQSHNDASKNSQTEIKEAQSRGQNPDVNNGDQSEDQSPQEWSWDGDQSSKNLVKPSLGLAKDNESQFPYPFEALSSWRFSQNVIKVEL